LDKPAKKLAFGLNLIQNNQSQMVMFVAFARQQTRHQIHGKGFL
jgi:hypothetical protein